MSTPNEYAECFLSQTSLVLDESERLRLGQLLSVLVETAQAARPTIHVEPMTFVRYVAERMAEEDDPCRALAALCGDDLYLACACAAGNDVAIRLFDKDCLTCIGAAVRRIHPDDEFVDEVQQVTRLKLLVPAAAGKLGKIATYRGRGKLRSWVQVGAVRTALELRRKSRPQDLRDDDDLMESADWNEDPELQHVRILYRREFSSAFKDALASLEARERNILRMYLLDGLNIDQIGVVYRVHRATVARWIAKSRERLLLETRRRLMERLKINEREFESLMVVVRSHLDLSLERFLNKS